MAHAMTRWLVRHHPRWWRARYEAEVLDLVECSEGGPGLVWDLFRSCARVWTECHAVGDPGPARTTPAGILYAGARCAQLLLATGVLMVTAGVLCLLVASVALSLAPPGLFLVMGLPVAASGIVALVGSRGVESRWTSDLRVRRIVGASTAACVVAMLALAVSGEPHFAVFDARWRASVVALGGRAFLVVGPLLWLGYASTVGLVVHWIFQGLHLGRCVFNCQHAPRAAPREVTA